MVEDDPCTIDAGAALTLMVGVGQETGTDLLKYPELLEHSQFTVPDSPGSRVPPPVRVCIFQKVPDFVPELSLRIMSTFSGCPCVVPVQLSV
jgi:hypothetical protein